MLFRPSEAIVKTILTGSEPTPYTEINGGDPACAARWEFRLVRKR
jgi:hypothetical protein